MISEMGFTGEDSGGKGGQRLFCSRKETGASGLRGLKFMVKSMWTDDMCEDREEF